MKIKLIFFFIWILSIFGFFAGLVFSPPDYASIPNNPWGTLIGLSLITGVVSFILMVVFMVIGKKEKSLDKDKESKIKSDVIVKNSVGSKNNNFLYFMIVLIIILVILAFSTGVTQNIYKQVTLRLFYSQLTQNIKNDDLTSQYGLLLPSDKAKISLNDWIEENAIQIKPYSRDFIVHSIQIVGNNGFVERTLIICLSQSCIGDDRLEDKAVKRYVFADGKWYIPLENTATLCQRTEPYPIPEEFKRALSLIVQREEQGPEDARMWAQSLKEIQNCLHIKYAESVLDMGDAEGYFTFSKNSSNDNLLIVVSPKYQIKDDLLTTILLSHEISHAMFFVGKLPYTCYENEAHAYTNQWAFMLLLNMEEKQSLVSRSKLQPTGDVYSIMYQLQQIQNQRGSSWYEQALNYVKSNDFYIKQCSSQ